MYVDIAKGHVRDKAHTLMKIIKPLNHVMFYLWHALQMNAVRGKVKYVTFQVDLNRCPYKHHICISCQYSGSISQVI